MLSYGHPSVSLERSEFISLKIAIASIIAGVLFSFCAKLEMLYKMVKTACKG